MLNAENMAGIHIETLIFESRVRRISSINSEQEKENELHREFYLIKSEVGLTAASYTARKKERKKIQK